MPTDVRFPDFFIFGAPKCGTTALYEYLSRHPGVAMSSVKEPQYFCTDFPDILQVHGGEVLLPAGGRARRRVVGRAGHASACIAS